MKERNKQRKCINYFTRNIRDEEREIKQKRIKGTQRKQEGERMLRDRSGEEEKHDNKKKRRRRRKRDFIHHAKKYRFLGGLKKNEKTY